MDPKVVAELQSQLEVEFSELQALIVDSNTFVARISSVWFHFQYAYDLIKRYLADGDNSEELKDALQKVLDSIRIFKTLVTKTSSKYEFVNSLTDRSKYYHEFRELDYDLLEIMEVVNKQDPTGSFASLSHILFDDELDLEMVREMLLGVKHYIKYTDDVDNEEHLASLSALIELIVRSTQFKQSKHFFNSNVVVTGMKPLVGTKLTNSEKSSRGYGSMHRCIWNGAMVGVKIIDRRLFQGDNLGVREAAILSELSSKRIESSPFLAPLLGVSYDLKSDRIYFLSKLAPCGNLHDLLLADTSRTEGLSASAKISILYDVVEGIKHLHIHGLVHGRLKASNVLLYANNRAKVCDYGVQGFLRNRSRLNFQGTDGIRWCPPEILLLETQIEDKKRAYEDSIVVAATSRGNQAPPQRRRSSTNGVNTDLHKKSFGNAVLDYSYLLTSSVDLYAVGLLGMSLLTEKIPFSNVEWEEGVAAQLLKGVVPTLPMSYRDKEILEKFENFILPCIGSVEGRPSILAVSQILEDVYLDITRGTLQAEFDQLQEDNEGVQADLKDLKIKLREHIKIISKGKELIAKREEGKHLIHNAQQRRDGELEINRAKSKLKKFEKELDGLKEDLTGAEYDAMELDRMMRDKAKELSMTDVQLLRKQQQPFGEDYEKTCLLEKYFHEENFEVISKLLTISSWEDFTSQNCLTSEETGNGDCTNPLLTHLIDVNNPFIPTSGSIRTVLNGSTIGRIESDITSGCFEHGYFAENLDSVFRIPVERDALPARIELYEEDMAFEHCYENFSRISSNFIRESNALRISSVQGTRDHALSIIDPRLRESAISIASSKFGVFVKAEETEIDSDDDGFSEESFPLEKAQVQPLSNGESEDANTEYISDEEEQQSDEDPDYPTDDYDAIHVEYLAASRGDWNEAVGMRRSGYGFSDSDVEHYIEKYFTPLHLCSINGHLEIFQRIVEREDFADEDVNCMDIDGRLPLHYASQRGHLSMVRYQIEEFRSPPDVADIKGVTPFQLALVGGFQSLVHYMMVQSPIKIARTFRDSERGASALHWACLSRQTSLLDYLINVQRLDINIKAEEDESTPLLWACYGGNINAVKYLLDANAAHWLKNKTKLSCLHFATASGNAEITQYLIDEIKVPLTEKDSRGRTPFDVARGKAAEFLKARKNRGFVIGSVVEKN